MSIQTLLPYVSCVCSADEIEEAKAQEFKEIYVITSKGTFKHHVLRGTNRFIRLKVDSIPGYKEPEIKEAFSFLPAGKIPYTLFEQIEAFFRKVTKLKGSQLEAMIFILWTAELGYHLWVPNQSVAAASVTFDPSTLPAGSIIVVDVHSHNSMGAFFSGTDNQNDATTVRFSGVFGKLNQPKAETIWRFNYYTRKLEATPADIFELPEVAEVEVPQEWLDKVDSSTRYPISQYKKNQGGQSHLGNVGPGAKSWDHLSGYQGKDLKSLRPSWHENQNLNDDMFADSQSEFFDHTPGMTAQDIANASRFAKWDNEPTEGEIHSINKGKVWRYDPKQKGFGEQNSPEDQINAVSDSHFANIVEDHTTQEEAGVTQLGKPERDALNAELLESMGMTMAPHTISSGQYEFIALKHGPDVADAWFSIDAEMAVLHGHDDLLEGLMEDMFNLVSEEARGKLFKSFYQILTSKDQEAIATNGF